MILLKYCIQTLLLLFFSLPNYSQPIAQAPNFKNQAVIHSSRKYDKSAIESIVYDGDYYGFAVKTKDGRGHFLNPKETLEYLGIALTDEGFLLPKDANITYYDQNGIPNGPYKKEYYTKANSKIFPLPVKAFQLRYGMAGFQKPLWLIDNKEVSKEEAMALHPKVIRAVDILNSDSAISLYGNGAKDGAVRISLKKILPKDTVNHIEFAPAFPGGIQAWKKFIDTSIRYPSAALKAGIRGQAKVRMTIEKDGSVSALAITQLGYGIEDEAIRIVTASPKWSPATRDGIPVIYRFIQSLTFDM